jgi:hypothetical protein
MAETKMDELFVKPVDEREKNKGMDEAPTYDGNRHFYEDVDGDLMEEDDIDDAHDNVLVTINEKKTPIIVIGNLFPNIGEFRMCFKTYVVKKEFDTMTAWTEKEVFCELQRL